MAHAYPPLNLEVRTPRLTLAAATDERLEQLVPVVRDGIVGDGPLPFDDPISFYAENPERVWGWLRGIWRGRGRVTDELWRLYFVVVVEGEAVGMQDLTGENFAKFGTVASFSWLAPSHRGKGLGAEMRAAILQLAFEGLDAKEAGSDAFADNVASNRVSERLGYTPNGVDWDTRQGAVAPITRWRLTRENWHPRPDIDLHGVAECRPVLGI